MDGDGRGDGGWRDMDEAELSEEFVRARDGWGGGAGGVCRCERAADWFTSLMVCMVCL